MKQIVQTELEYCEWANRRLLQACEVLSPEEISRDLGASHRSVIETLRHILYGERVWIHRIVHRLMPPFHLLADPSADPGPPLDADIDVVREHWKLVWDTTHAWIECVTESDLNTPLLSERIDGDCFTTSPWQIALHLVNHSTLHRGQIITMFRALGKQPPNLDLFTFYWDK